jgi:hypothetical protein
MCESMQLAMLARGERRLDRANQGLREEIARKQFIIDIDQILIRGLVHLVDDLRAEIEAGAPTRICGYADTKELRDLLLQRAWEAPDLADSLQIIELVDRLDSSQEMEQT